MPKSVRLILLVVVALFLGLVLIDTLGVFDNKSYYEIPHGNHTHYMPKDCDPPVPVDRAPTHPPGPNEHITCSGQIVPN